ncbi:MAG TPA: DUF6452 family protein [Prolixibacteraceae bacterium]|nr:DUF6452 family protein [Prolixibacteraceae bacterium]
MNARLPSRFFLILATGLWLVSACDVPPCEQEGVFLNGTFYHFDGSTLQDTLFDSLRIYLGNEELLLLSDQSGSSVGSFRLPLSANDEQSRFVFLFGNELSDTLIVHHTASLHLLSHECGFVHFFELTDVETGAGVIDSVWIRKPRVDYGEDENIKIYF